MNSAPIIIPLLLGTVCFGSAIHLLRTLRREKQVLALVGLFCLAMGVFLLLLDLALITFTHGPQYIPDYLLFNRLVSDSGFAGRWMLTVYLFISSGILISIYLLARKAVNKFNTK